MKNTMRRIGRFITNIDVLTIIVILILFMVIVPVTASLIRTAITDTIYDQPVMFASTRIQDYDVPVCPGDIMHIDYDVRVNNGPVVGIIVRTFWDNDERHTEFSDSQPEHVIWMPEDIISRHEHIEVPELEAPGDYTLRIAVASISPIGGADVIFVHLYASDTCDGG